jgi:hypothetical protein
MYLLMYIHRKEKQNFKYPKVIFSVVPLLRCNLFQTFS